MYSSLCYIMQRDGTSVSISTVEDPVEFNLPMVSQTQINPAQEFTYAIALRSIMRQDPQVIMVGEIRDAETAAIAVQAGLTGHLVLSTIHCGVSAGAFTRLINMEIEPFMLASSILGVMGLRLVRSICPNCAQPYEPAPSQLKVVPGGARPPGPIPPGRRLRSVQPDRLRRPAARQRAAGRRRALPRSRAQEDAHLRPRGNRHPARHAHPLAERAYPRHHRPDHARRNHPRPGRRHDVKAKGHKNARLLACSRSSLGTWLRGRERGLPPSDGIGNFGKVNDRLYRGAQPDAAGDHEPQEAWALRPSSTCA